MAIRIFLIVDSMTQNIDIFSTFMLFTRHSLLRVTLRHDRPQLHSPPITTNDLSIVATVCVHMRVLKLCTLTPLFVQMAVQAYLALVPHEFQPYHNQLALFSGMIQQTSLSRNFTIIIHSSDKTKSRLEKFFKLYYRPIPGVNYLVIYPNNSQPDSRIPSLITPCQPLRLAVQGLNCRDQFAFEYFLNNSWTGDFLYRGMDDTMLNIYNLAKYISKLRQVYNPLEEVVFKSSINLQMKAMNGSEMIGGGAGWIQSRAMVAIHTLPTMSMYDMYDDNFTFQDDMTETRIYQRLNFSASDVRSIQMGDDCEGICPKLWWKIFGFRVAPKCKEGAEIFPMNEIISFHSGLHVPRTHQFGRWLGRYPSDLYCAMFEGRRGYIPCRADPAIENEQLTVEYLRKTAKHVSFVEAKKLVENSVEHYASFIEFMRTAPRHPNKWVQPAYRYGKDHIAVGW